jgi:hypothetical protein
LLKRTAIPILFGNIVYLQYLKQQIAITELAYDARKATEVVNDVTNMEKNA